MARLTHNAGDQIIRRGFDAQSDIQELAAGMREKPGPTALFRDAGAASIQHHCSIDLARLTLRGPCMKRFAIGLLAFLCLALPAMAQVDFTSQAIMMTFANMNQQPPAPDADVGDYGNIHTLAILCTMNDSMPLHGEGKDGSLGIAPWQAGARLCGIVRKRLAGRFEFVDAPVDPAAFARSASRLGAVKAFLKAQANPGIDAYLIVRPIRGGSFEPGVTLRTQAAAGDASLAVNYEIDIIDARKFSTVGDAEARMRLREPQHAYFPAATVRNIDKQALVDGTDPAALERIHRALEWSLELSAVETLRALKLDIALPPIGDHGIATPPLAGEMAGYRTVGIISAAGEDMRLTIGGHMFVDKKSLVLPASFSGLDRQMEDMSASVLARNHAVKPVPVDRALLSNVEISKNGTLEPIAGLPPSSDVDAYVLILRQPVGEGEIKSVGGIGVAHWMIAMSENKLEVYANLGMAIVDAHTLKVIGVSMLRQGPKDVCNSDPFLSPSANCRIDEKMYAPDKSGSLTDGAKAEIRANVQKMLADAIPETLFALGLDSAGAPAL